MSEPYRTDHAALTERQQQLREELSHLDAVAARRRALEAELAEVERALSTDWMLEGLRIASPCKASWEDMSGDDRVRHCASCDKDVYNVAGMTRAEATRLMHERLPEGVCIRMFKRADGTVLTADCPVGERKKRVRRLVMAGAGVLAGASGLWAWADTTSQTLGGVEPRTPAGCKMPPTMGSAAAVVAPPPIMGTAEAVTMGSAATEQAPPTVVTPRAAKTKTDARGTTR